MRNISTYHYFKKNNDPGIFMLRNVSFFTDLKFFLSFYLSEFHNSLCS